uniref:Uncharacterized protein n=1 Tax=Sus scrofa TaxID=9823 RepID=A0A8D0QIG0_PIG
LPPSSGSPSPESCAPAAAAEVSAVWAGLEAGAGSGGASAQGCGEAQQALARCLHLGGPEAGWAWPNRKRGTKSRLPLAASRQRPPAEGPVGLPSDPESSDEFGEIQLMRVSIYPRGGGQAQPCSPEAPGFTLPHFQVRENFLHVPGAFLAPALRGFTSVVERQGVGEPDISSPKKMQSILWGKEGSRPSYPGAAVAAAAAAAAAAAKGAQEKKPLGGASALALGRTFPPWGQRVSAAPLEPATFPPIAGVPLLGRSRKYSLVPSGTKQSKHAGAGKKPAARRARESELVVAGEDNDPDGDQVARGQVSRPCSDPAPTLPAAPRPLFLFPPAPSVYPSGVFSGHPWVILVIRMPDGGRPTRDTHEGSTLSEQGRALHPGPMSHLLPQAGAGMEEGGARS